MGLFDFLRKLLGGSPPAPPSRPRPQAPAPQTNWPPAQPQGFDRNRATAPSTWQAPISSAPRQPQQPRQAALNLEASQFQPLSTDEAKAAAQGQQFSSFWEFGRQSRIPSALDPRTKLIDQAMVGQGLISPDELVRIHEIGHKMDELRPEQVSVHTLAERAVQADKEARRRIKEEKKRAAEERKRAHAERVARNRLTDIVHLGRGVSAGLADRRSNVEKLAAQNLPLLSTPAEVAAALKLPVPRLRWLAYHAEASPVSHYVQFLVPKKSGGERMLSAPHAQLAAAQRWIFDNIVNKLTAHDAAHGFVTGRNIVSNANPHIASAVVVNCDLTNFFPSITVHRVIGLFRQIGYSPAAATVLALLVTDSPRRKVLFNGKPWYVATGPRGLPQGACTSPGISNLIARRLDSRLSGICRKLGWAYTRYADDLSFSSKTPSDRIGYLLARIRHIARDEGFDVNEKKTRVLKPGARQMVTGVVTNARPGTPRFLRRRLRAILHNAKKTGLATQNRRQVPHFTAWLGGTIEFVSMVNPAQGQPLKTEFAKVAGRPSP
jgi:RNA-directed DNA polymerase